MSDADIVRHGLLTYGTHDAAADEALAALARMEERWVSWGDEQARLKAERDRLKDQLTEATQRVEHYENFDGTIAEHSRLQHERDEVIAKLTERRQSAPTEDERHIVGRTCAELLHYFDEAKTQSFRENPYWRMPGNVPLLYALDYIECLERQHNEAVANGLRLAEENEQWKREYDRENRGRQILDGMLKKAEAKVERLRALRDDDAKKLLGQVMKIEQLRADKSEKSEALLKRSENDAAQIAKLRAEVERLRAALEQIANDIGLWEPEGLALAAFARQALEGSTNELRG